MYPHVRYSPPQKARLMLLDTPDLACPMNGTLSRSTSSRERQQEDLAFRHSLYIYGPIVSQNQRYALSPLFLPPPSVSVCHCCPPLPSCGLLFPSSWCCSQQKTTDSWKRKKQGSGYMVNPVSNKKITLDQVLAVEFLQQEFRRKVAQR